MEAQKEVHELALKINRMEREAFQLEQMQQRVREIEQLIDGVIDVRIEIQIAYMYIFLKHCVQNIYGCLLNYF